MSTPETGYKLIEICSNRKLLQSKIVINNLYYIGLILYT